MWKGLETNTTYSKVKGQRNLGEITSIKRRFPKLSVNEDNELREKGGWIRGEAGEVIRKIRDKLPVEM